MGKLAKRIAKGLTESTKKAVKNVSNDVPSEEEQVQESIDINDLLNAGVELHESRTKEKEVDSSSEETPAKAGSTYEETCERDLRKARENNYPDPDFDFRDEYQRGQIVYFVRICEKLKEKEFKKLFIRTVYPRVMVGSEEKAACQCISYYERDQVFRTAREATDYFNSINLHDAKEDIPEQDSKENTDEQEETKNDEES